MINAFQHDAFQKDAFQVVENASINLTGVSAVSLIGNLTLYSDAGITVAGQLLTSSMGASAIEAEANAIVTGVQALTSIGFPAVSFVRTEDKRISGGGAYYQPILNIFKDLKKERVDVVVNVDGVNATTTTSLIKIISEIFENEEEIMQLLMAIVDIDAKTPHQYGYDEEDAIKMILKLIA